MIAENIVHFARAAHRGIAIGPDRVPPQRPRSEAVGVGRRDDAHAALSAVMIDRHEQQVIFDAAFDAFWRDPKLLGAADVPAPAQDHRPWRQGRAAANRRRLAEAPGGAAPAGAAEPNNETAKEELRFDTTFTFSDRERLAQTDFETMTAAEFELAKKLCRARCRCRWTRCAGAATRRRGCAADSRVDLRATLQTLARQPHLLLPAHTQVRAPNCRRVVVRSTFGSIDRYSRLFLHYVHALTRRYLKGCTR